MGTVERIKAVERQRERSRTDKGSADRRDLVQWRGRNRMGRGKGGRRRSKGERPGTEKRDEWKEQDRKAVRGGNSRKGKGLRTEETG